MNVPAGTYLYKFVNGNAWGRDELVPATCGITDGGGNVNRQVVVGGSAVRLPIVAFADCATQLRFAVDMIGQTVARTGVHVVGNFQALAGYGTTNDATALPLTDDNKDGIYEVTIALPAPGVYSVPLRERQHPGRGRNRARRLRHRRCRRHPHPRGERHGRREHHAQLLLRHLHGLQRAHARQLPHLLVE